MKFGIFNVMQLRDRSQSAAQAIHEAVNQAVTVEGVAYERSG